MKRDLVVLGAITLMLGAMGGPPMYHVDSLTPHALHALRNAGDPGFFGYPALVIDLEAALWGVWLVFAPSAARGVPSDLPAQVVTLAFSLLGVGCAWGIAFRLTRDRNWALLAGAFTACSLLWVANSHYPTVDVPLAALAAATVLAVLVTTVAVPPTRAALAGLGALVGLTTATKYNGALVALAVVLPLVVARRGPHRRVLADLALVAEIAVLTFVLVNPTIVPRFHRFTVSLRTEWMHSRLGHPGYQVDGPSWGYHLATTLPQGCGLAALVLAALGLARSVIDRTLHLPEKLALAIFPISWFGIMGASRLTFHRYMVPLIPFLAVYSALGARAVLTSVSRAVGRAGALRAVAPALTGLLVLFALGPNLAADIRHDRLLLLPDTRAVLHQAFQKIRPAGRSLEIAAGGYLLLDRIPVRVRPLAPAADTGSLGAHPRSPDLWMIDSFDHDCMLYDPAAAESLALPAGPLHNRVIQVSPFTRPREAVPFSPQSGSSPYPPDLWLRSHPGPFIEIVASDSQLATKITAACTYQGVSARVISRDQSFYMRRLSR